MNEERIPIKIILRKNDTGEIVEYCDDALADEDGPPYLYIWEDGNYSCDCNRAMFWARAKKIEPPKETQCSDGKFSVNIYSMNGKLLYKEFEENK